MSKTHFAILPDRGVVAVTGEDARHFLDNLVTNDMALLDGQDAMHAALLTPQGKILATFFVVGRPDGYLMETGRQEAADLVKRLSLYKLRAKVALNDISENRVVVASWGGPPPSDLLGVTYTDPRHRGLGHRTIMAAPMAAKLAAEDEGPEAYDRHRIGLGVGQAGIDYKLGDAFPHEANLDRQAGVSFTKGCFVGQEVVARMQHKAVVRKRVTRIEGTAPLVAGAAIMAGEAEIGTIGSVAGTAALAMLRLDRALEAQQKGEALTAGDIPLTVEPAALEAYRSAVAQRVG
jgi:hypothetical protein